MAELKYETVIGLETHAQFLTASKMFCGCQTTFGAPPNTQTCPVCQGLPGVLPVVNRKAFELGLKTCLALHCEIPPATQFDRKNYYYPDLPKNYQISQNYCPIGTNGWIDLDVGGRPRRVRIWNVHLEEDAGKLEHPEDTGANYTAVDLNRAGTPLLEIVSAPDMRSAEEANAYMNELAATLRYLDISDCKMQEGSLRFEAGISVRPVGADRLGNRVEVKNLNSMSAVVHAIEYETRRQIDVLESGGIVASQTMLWNTARGVTEPMRSKEEAKDYRYFPEPDLVPIEITADMLDRIRAEMRELPGDRRRRFVEQYGLPRPDANVLVANRALADYFEATTRAGADPKAAANWLMGEVLRELNERKCGIADLGVTPEMLAELIGFVARGEVSNNIGKDIFAEMAASGKRAAAIIESKGLRQISDSGELKAAVAAVLAQNASAVADLRAGKKQARGFLLGQVMRATGGKANPKLAGELIDKLTR